MGFGLYHPSFNAKGCMKASDDKFWYDTAETFNTKADCFNPAKLLAGSGTIASGKSGRPDGKYGDAVYSSGEYGVVDLRLSAYDMSAPHEASKAWEKVKNGTYRGLEKLVWSKPYVTTHSNATYGGGRTLVYVDGVREQQEDVLPRGYYANVKLNGYVCSTVSTNANGDYVYLHESVGDVSSEFPLGTTVVFTNETETSVSGNFTQTDVIGDPANILLTDALKDGWQGSWIPVIPAGTNMVCPLTKKSLVSSRTNTYTLDNGSSWTSSMSSINTTTNSVDGVIPLDYIGIWTYTAFAKVFTEYEQGDIIYGTDRDILATASHDITKGCLVTESTVGKVATGDSSKDVGHFGLVDYQTGLSIPNDSEQTHSPINLLSADSSVGVKLQSHLVVNNGQVSGGAYYSEIVKGVDWGGDSLVVSNSLDTLVDTNNETVSTGRVVTSIPIGWQKNVASFGESDT